MKVLNDKNQNLWHEVEKNLDEATFAGYKMACIEAYKNFKFILDAKGYPIENVNNTIDLFGWKLTNKEALKDAIKKTETIMSSFEYRLSNFEAEDIVEIFKQAIVDFSEKKDLTWQRKATLFVENNVKSKNGIVKKLVAFVLLVLLVIKLLAHTTLGLQTVEIFVKISDFIYSWLVLFVIVSMGLFVFIIFSFSFFEKKNTKIKSIKEK